MISIFTTLKLQRKALYKYWRCTLGGCKFGPIISPNPLRGLGKLLGQIRTHLDNDFLILRLLRSLHLRILFGNLIIRRKNSLPSAILSSHVKFPQSPKGSSADLVQAASQPWSASYFEPMLHWASPKSLINIHDFNNWAGSERLRLPYPIIFIIHIIR